MALALGLLGSVTPLSSHAADATSNDSAVGPVRLVAPPQTPRSTGTEAGSEQSREYPRETQRESLRPPQPSAREPRKLIDMSEFERYVQRAVGEEVEVQRFGMELLNARVGTPGEGSSQIPGDYIVSVGDELVVNLWGAVEADLRLVVDRSGRITIPRVGPVMVAGLRYAELNTAIDQRVSQVFKNYRLSTSLGRLRSIRVYVTGFTLKPGAYAVSSLSTIVNALIQAGGPSPAGSLRHIELRRGGKLVSQFDLYELLLRGDKAADRVLQADDVVHIGPVGQQVALIGSVNRPGIFELKPSETIDDLLQMGAGFSAVADRSRLAVESLDTRNDVRITEFKLPQQMRASLKSGDLVRAFNATDALLPQHRQNKRVRVEGEVQRPGEYILPPQSSLMDAVRAAGGLTPGAFVYGAEFNRESVRITQQIQYERALRDLETEFARIQVTQKALTADEANAQGARVQSSNRLIDRLRAVKPTGRIVLQTAPNAVSLPELAVEDGDRLVVPARPTTVGVFGSVFNGGSFVFRPDASVEDMLRLAGGPTRGADTSSTFVIRANGSVVSAKQQSTGWLSLSSGFSTLPALPGDTVFVPEDLTRTTFSQEAKEWTQILYQFGLGAAALKTLKN
jgi:protein involved in polysaccharide export with SLBB domain